MLELVWLIFALHGLSCFYLAVSLFLAPCLMAQVAAQVPAITSAFWFVTAGSWEGGVEKDFCFKETSAVMLLFIESHTALCSCKGV